MSGSKRINLSGALLLWLCGSVCVPLVFAGCSSRPCACPDPWPQLLIGIIPPAGFSGDERTVLRSVNVTLFDGTVIDVLPQTNSCPQSVVSLPCSRAIYDGVNSQNIDIEAQPLSGDPVSLSVPIKARNHCGVDVAYAQVIVDGDSSVHFGNTRYVSPCP